MDFDKYLVSIEDQLNSETRDIGPPAAKNKALKKPTSNSISTSRVSSTSRGELPPPNKSQPLTPIQRSRTSTTLYKNFRLDPLSQPFVTPLKRSHSQQYDNNGSKDVTADCNHLEDSHGLTTGYNNLKDSPAVIATLAEQEESGLQLGDTRQNDYDKDEEGDGVSNIICSQNPSSSQVQLAPAFTAESTSRDGNETYPDSGPWTADAYALFG